MKPINIPPFKVGDRVYSELWRRFRTVDRIERDGGSWWFFEGSYLCCCDDYERINEETPDQRPEVPAFVTHPAVFYHDTQMVSYKGFMVSRELWEDSGRPWPPRGITLLDIPERNPALDLSSQHQGRSVTHTWIDETHELPTHLWGIPVVYDTPPTASGSGQSGTDEQ
jgi:hypothetical protein